MCEVSCDAQMDDPSVPENGSTFSSCQQDWIEYAAAFNSQLNNINGWMVLLMQQGSEELACIYSCLVDKLLGVQSTGSAQEKSDC